MTTFLRRRLAPLFLIVLALSLAGRVSARAQTTTETLTVDGDTVTILRDKYGVPHVFASTARGLYYGNGYAVAEDRLAQMEMYRRDARGEMAEIMGRKSLAADKEMRLDSYSEEERQAHFKQLPADGQLIMQAYADGVNAWREKAVAEGKIPTRLTDLGVTPAPWRVTDTIAVGEMMARRFGGSEAGELRNLQILAYLKSRAPKDVWALLNDLTWMNDPKAPVTVPDSESPRRFGGQTGYPEKAINVETYLGKSAQAVDPASLRSGIAQLDRQAETVRAKDLNLPTKLGSYGIVVSANKSVTGNAMLVGGPQMGWMTPQIAHEIHLSGAGYDVIGMGFAGSPGVLIGHNPYIAWTFTSGLADFADIFAEKLNPANPNQYWYKGAWHDMEKRTEVINVKGEDPVMLDIYRTVHGPVAQFDKTHNRAFSVMASYWNKELDSLGVYQKYYMAHTVQEVLEAAKKLPTSFNAIVADQSGNIGYRYCGYAPIRADGIDPRLPTPGTGEYEWKGFVSPDDMPHGINPKQGFFCNWNNKPASWWNNGDTPYWGAIWHVSRIADVLRSKPKMTTEDLRYLLMDIGTYDITAEYFVPMLLHAGKRETSKLTPASEQALTYMGAWNYRSEDGSVAKRIYDAWIQQVREDLFLKVYGSLNPFGNDLSLFNLAMQPSFILHVLEAKKSPVPVHYDFLKGRTPDDVMVTALNKVVEKLAASNGPTMGEWRYAHPLYNIHPLPGFPSYDRGTYIQIVELAKPLITGVNVLAPGQNENAGNPHYSDQLSLAAWWWFKPMLTDRAKIEKAAGETHGLTVGIEGVDPDQELQP